MTAFIRYDDQVAVDEVVANITEKLTKDKEAYVSFNSTKMTAQYIANIRSVLSKQFHLCRFIDGARLVEMNCSLKG